MSTRTGAPGQLGAVEGVCGHLPPAATMVAPWYTDATEPTSAVSASSRDHATGWAGAPPGDGGGRAMGVTSLGDWRLELRLCGWPRLPWHIGMCDARLDG
ncbi:hypothetical protein NDU88_008574 [Pleurodeles waltl]|uniref:Uncharacterized protein n=1 Tax=Pleurodeles waltl TaxID=8319 RepID=A0AAV7NDH3_PLEWA|nr:hypothetical protein NDU88_008574 [Pleurodeles waltl]